ncbi:helix-turn-helix domain-containing protein [Mycobacterium sp. LTG2003]
MTVTVYSAEQVADILGLHVRTVRAYVRDGRLPAVRMGKQYRITEQDLRAFTGATADKPAGKPHAHVSAVAHVHNVDRLMMDRVTTHLTAAAVGDRSRQTPLNVHSTYDETACRLTIFVDGDPASTSALIGLIDALIDQEEK